MALRVLTVLFQGFIIGSVLVAGYFTIKGVIEDRKKGKLPDIFRVAEGEEIRRRNEHTITQFIKGGKECR